MNIEETSILLSKVQAFDNRNVSDPTIIAWQEALASQPLEDALEAVRRFFAKETGWVMPGDIFRLARQVRADRERDGQKQSAIEAAAIEAAPVVTHKAIEQTVKERYAKQYEIGVRQGNSERAYNVEMRNSGDTTKAHAAARAVRDA